MARKLKTVKEIVRKPSKSLSDFGRKYGELLEVADLDFLQNCAEFFEYAHQKTLLVIKQRKDADKEENK